jgi:3-hydroxyisobutyrate dehydrogenase-like beta-hydroxyacid dehydrogenase
MANRLLAANQLAVVYNRNRKKCLPFAKAGVFIAESPREAASRA